MMPGPITPDLQHLLRMATPATGLQWSSQVHRAVTALHLYGIERLYGDMERAGLACDGLLRVDDDARFNAFARMAAGVTPNRAEAESTLLGDEASRWFVARGLPENEAHWADPLPPWSTGQAAMSATHRFICPRSLDWRLCNVVVALATMPRAEMVDTTRSLRRAVDNLSDGLGLNQRAAYLHPLGLCSVYSWHTHVIDLGQTGLSFEAQRHKNLPLPIAHAAALTLPRPPPMSAP